MLRSLIATGEAALIISIATVSGADDNWPSLTVNSNVTIPTTVGVKVGFGLVALDSVTSEPPT